MSCTTATWRDRADYCMLLKIRQLIKEILHCKSYMYVNTEYKAWSLCSSSAALLTSKEDAGTWDLWTFNLWVTETGCCTRGSHSRTTPFSLQTNTSVAAHLTAMWIFLNPGVLRIKPPGPPYLFVWGKIAAATRTHIHTNIHTHPGGLLQMVATERVVQVEADNIAVRQTKVFAHCGQNCRRRLTGPYRLLHAHVRDTAADMSMSHCVTARTGLCCVNARLALLTVRPQDCTVPLSRTIRQ